MASLLDTYPLNDAYRDRVYPEEQESHRRATTPTRADAGALGRLNVLAGIEMGEIGAFRAGQTAYNTGVGWHWGVDPTDGPRFSIGSSVLGANKLLWTGSELVIVGNVTATTGEIGGWTIGASTLTGGDTRLDSTGIIEVGTGNNLVKLSSVDATYRLWAGNADPALAPFSVTQAGSLSATAGVIGGWTIQSTYLESSNVTINSNGNITLGTSNNVVRLSASHATYRLWVGHATAGSAPFRVTQGGALTATGATISGNITATTGDIGGWSIGSATLTGGAVVLDSAGVISAGSGNNIAVMSGADATYRIWAGNATAGSAPFRVTQAGEVTVESLTGSSINADVIDSGTLDGLLLALQSVVTDAIKDLNITAPKIGGGAVETAKIADLAVTDAKIANLTASKITTGTLASEVITIGTGGSLQWDGGNSFIDSDKIVLNSYSGADNQILWRYDGLNKGTIYGDSGLGFVLTPINADLWIVGAAGDGIAIDTGFDSGTGVIKVGAGGKLTLEAYTDDVEITANTYDHTFDSFGRFIAANAIYPNGQTSRALTDDGFNLGVNSDFRVSGGDVYLGASGSNEWRIQRETGGTQNIIYLRYNSEFGMRLTRQGTDDFDLEVMVGGTWTKIAG